MLTDFNIQGVCLSMEIDTDAAVNLISQVTFNRHFPISLYLRVQHDSQQLQAIETVCGEFKAKVRYGQQVRECMLR